MLSAWHGVICEGWVHGKQGDIVCMVHACAGYDQPDGDSLVRDARPNQDGEARRHHHHNHHLFLQHTCFNQDVCFNMHACGVPWLCIMWCPMVVHRWFICVCLNSWGMGTP